MLRPRTTRHHDDRCHPAWPGGGILLAGLLVGLWLPGVSLAEPSITAVSGKVSQGSEVTIRGLRFGSWAPTNILTWDDFDEDGSGRYQVGQEIPGQPKIGFWSATRKTDAWSVSALVDNRYAVSGPQSMWGHRGLADWSGAKVPIGELRHLYVSFWFRYNCEGSGRINLLQVKGTQIGSCYDYEPIVSTGDLSSEWRSYIGLDEPFGTFGCDITDPRNNTYRTVPGQNHWNFFEASLIQSDPGKSDGHVEIKVNGVRQFYQSPVLTRVLPQSRWTLVEMLNGMPNYARAHTWVDDFYVANRFCRVFLGNGPTYPTSERFFIQIPADWSEDAITVRVNQGTFQKGQTAYLYVVDASGAMNDVGYPVTVDTGIRDKIDPTAPHRLVADRPPKAP